MGFAEPLASLDKVACFEPAFDARKLEDAAVRKRAWRLLVLHVAQGSQAVPRWLPAALRAGQDGHGWDGALAFTILLRTDHALEGLAALRLGWRAGPEEIAVAASVAATLRRAGAPAQRLEQAVIDAGGPAADQLSPAARAMLLLQWPSALVEEARTLAAQTAVEFSEVQT